MSGRSPALAVLLGLSIAGQAPAVGADALPPLATERLRVQGLHRVVRFFVPEQTAEVFRRLAKAPATPATRRFPDRDPDDGTRIESSRWIGAAGHEVVLIRVIGGGHSLPGTNSRFSRAVVGRTSRDLDGAELIWELFARRLPRR